MQDDLGTQKVDNAINSSTTHQSEPTSSLLLQNYFGSGVDSDAMVTNELIHQALSLYCTIRDEKDSAFPYSSYKKRLDRLTRRALKRYKRRMKSYSSELDTD